jgi:MFS family permease
MSSIGTTRGFAALKHRDFALYLCTRLCASLAAQMIVVAVGWQVYHITGRLMDLGFIGLSQFLPFLLLVLFAGHVADQFDRRSILVTVITVQLLCTVALLGFALAANGQSWLPPWGPSGPHPVGHAGGSTWPIFLVLACLGVARAFQMPAAQSFLPNLVPTSILGNAVALNSSVFQVGTIVGPSLGGAVYAFAQGPQAGAPSGAARVYAAAAFLLFTALALMSLIRTRRRSAERQAASWSVLLQGLRFVWQRKTVLGAISLDLFAVLFGGATALLPAFTQDVLHAGPEVFGLLRTAPGVGAALTAVILAFRPIRRRVGRIMFAGVGIFGVATVVFGLTQRFWVALAALVALGAGDMVSVFVRSLLVQLETPDEIRGRVSAVNAVFIGASNELGEFESGLTAAWMGLVPAIVFGGVATLAVAVLWSRWLFPSLWRMNAFSERQASGLAKR